MSQIVEIPDVGEVEFPDEMNESEISDAIQKRILKQPEIAPEPPPIKLDPIQNSIGAAQMQTGMVNPSSDRNVLQIPSETEREASRIALEAPTRTVMAPFNALGRVGNAAVQDAAATLTGNPGYGGNLLELWRQPEGVQLPYQKTLALISKSNPVVATAGKIASGVVESLPIAAAVPAGEIGRLASIGFSADMFKAGGAAAVDLYDELQKPKEERDADKITTAVSTLAQSSVFAPLAAYHGVKPGPNMAAELAKKLNNAELEPRATVEQPPLRIPAPNKVPETPIPAQSEIPLGLNRPNLVDDSLKVLGEDEFDAHFKSAKQSVNKAEKLYDSTPDLTPEQRQQIADAQDKWSAAINERFRRNSEGTDTPDLFDEMIDLADKGTDFDRFKILAGIIQKRGNARASDVTALVDMLPERIKGSPDFREALGGKLVKFKTWLEKAANEIESKPIETEVAKPAPTSTPEEVRPESTDGGIPPSSIEGPAPATAFQNISPPEFFDWAKGKDLNAEQSRLAQEMSAEDIQKAATSSAATAEAARAKVADAESANAFADAANLNQFWNETLAKSKSAGETKINAESRSVEPKSGDESWRFNRKSADEKAKSLSNDELESAYQEAHKIPGNSWTHSYRRELESRGLWPEPSGPSQSQEPQPAKSQIEQPTKTPQPPANLPPSASMGGALPSELARGQGSPTAMKYKLIDQERQQRGLPPLLKPESVSDQALMDKAMAAIDQNPKVPDDLVKELLAKPRTIEAWERMVLLLHKIDLRNAYEKSAREAAQAFDDSKQFPDREADMVRANLETARISDELTRLEQASRESGSETGRALRSLQIMANEDYSLAALETRLRAEKGGAPLTDTERAELTKTAEDYKKANEELQQHMDERVKRESDAAVKEALSKVEKEAKSTEVHPKIIQIAERIVASLDKRADAARQRIKERGFRFNTGVDPTVLRDVAEIGAAHLGHKVLDFAKWSEKMISEFGDGIKPHLDEIFKASNQIIDDLKTTPAIKREIKKPDLTTQIAGASEKVQEKLKSGKRDEISGDVNRLARWLLEAKLVDGREKLIDALHTILNKGDPSITRRETMDALSGYGDFKQLTKDDISVKLRGYRGELQQIAKLEDMAANKPPLKTGVERRSPTDDERALIKAVNEAKIKFQVPITDPATQLKSALDTRKTQVENQIKDMERRLRESDFTKKPRRELVVDRRLQELTAKRDAVKKKVRAAEVEARNKLKTNFEKTFDWISNARRFAVLSGNKVLLKLAAYSATKLPTMFATEAAGGVLGKLPFLRKVAEKAPSEGGFSARAISTSAAKFFTKGLDDAYKTAVEGHSDIKSAFSAKPELQRHWYDFAQAMHEVIKSPLRRAAFELSLAKRMEFAARKGTDIADPLVQMLLAKDAYLDSDRALLLESNRLSSGIRGLFKQLEQKSKTTGQIPMHGKVAATIGRVEFPILSVPLNYVKQTLTAAFGLISGSAKLAAAFKNGIEKLSPEEADSIMRHFKYGSIGGAVLLYGFYDGYHNGANGTFGGFYQPHEKRRKDQAQFGGMRIGGQNVSSVFLHNPMIAVGQLGHTIGAIAAQKVKKNSPEERGVGIGALAGTLGLLNESPLGRTTELVSTLSDPRSAGYATDEHIKGIVIPQLMNEMAQFTDKPAQNLQDYFLMDTRKRDPKTLKQHLMTGVPVLREQVPLKK